ncbi:Lateral organ boundaries, LOB [Dillenia turbinata]|uniref:Lateral organ boundaries, LOB n=1 Tax=Dillenia turbinata TaxID=194707 RepID=A0AAN8UYC4_9MAGN
MSCNGCRVLRKGCSEDCSIRPCLQWIKTPEAQANATVFLAKFYGRAGLMNLIHAGPQHLRPAIFKSLLYEACGRIVNPIYGSAGLLWSWSWQLCQAAVEALLCSAPIMQISSDSAVAMSPPFKACDIRHVSRGERPTGSAAEPLRRVSTRSKFKRSGASTKPKPEIKDLVPAGGRRWSKPELERSTSRESVSQQPEEDSESVETVEASLAKAEEERADGADVGLVLTLGLGIAFGSGNGGSDCGLV